MLELMQQFSYLQLINAIEI